MNSELSGESPRAVTSSSRSRRSGRALVTVILLLCIASLIGVIAFFAQGQTPEEEAATVLLHRVERGDFEAFVTEPGDVASSSNIEVRCRVKSRGSAGTAILKICDEGTDVKAGDFLVQFDDSVLQNELTQQKIVVANDKALLIQAKSNLANAERTLKEYVDGLFAQERETLESELFVAEEELRRRQLSLASSERLAARGIIKPLQLTAEKFAVEKAKKDVKAGERKLDVYERFTKEKMVGEYKATIEKEEANVEAAQFTLDLSNQKLKEIEQQIDHCLVKAPAEGQVVHANDPWRRNEVIEEGTLIRDNQIIIRLPDIDNMQVDVRINESHVNRIKPGQPARIELDADPENVLHGEVKEVAPYPFPMRWHGAPLEYGTVVKIIDPPSTIRPGLRAKVKISFESQSDVLMIPIASLIVNEGMHYCLIRENQDWRVQEVKIGSNNNNQVIIHEGLEEGDRVALTPFQYIERSDLPSSLPEEDAERRERNPDPSTLSKSAR